MGDDARIQRSSHIREHIGNHLEQSGLPIIMMGGGDVWIWDRWEEERRECGGVGLASTADRLK